MTIFIQCFCNREPAGVPRDQVQQIFGSYLTIRKLNEWHLYYDEVTYCDITISPLEENEDLSNSPQIKTRSKTQECPRSGRSWVSWFYI